MSQLPRILVVDDQESILRNFQTLLEPSRRSETAISLADLEAALGGEATTTEHFELPSYAMTYAQQGQGAVAHCADAVAAGDPFSVAFVDVHMPPGIDGVQTAIELWKLQPDLEIVLCTAHAIYTWPEILARLPRRDQLVILRKPFDPIEVRQLAACLTEKARRGRELAQQMMQLEAQVQREVTRRLHSELAGSRKFDDLGRLAAGIAHEISTPAQYIQSNLDFLSEIVGELVVAPATPVVWDELRGAIDEALNGVKRVTTIVRSVREFAHQSYNAFEELDVNQLVRMAAELARSEYKYDAELILDLREVPTLRGDPDELGRSIMNLLINGAHAIRAKRRDGDRLGRLTISTQAVPGSVVISVTDTGTGIPEEHHARVFEPFFTTKARGVGTGQGLALVQTMVEHHRGTVRFDTVANVGTTFVITLPIQAAVNAA